MNDFIEYLEEMMDFKRTCNIKFIGDNGGIATINARLTNIHIAAEDSYIKTVDGLKIAIKQLIEVNGKRAQNIC
jgi:hypothetical protein